MKKIIILWIFVSINTFASDPNFNSTTHIVNFPRVTVDNQIAYFDVQLLLSPGGTWNILSEDVEDEKPTENIENDPNFNSTTHIVNFPRVTVDNQIVYSDVQLLLSPEGTWRILQSEIINNNVNGGWNGSAIDSGNPLSMNIETCLLETTITLIQNDNELTGIGAISECELAGIAGGTGNIQGTIAGNNIFFEIHLEDRIIGYSGIANTDHLILSTPSVWPNRNSITLNLQKIISKEKEKSNNNLYITP